jgi:hypothetical protein
MKRVAWLVIASLGLPPLLLSGCDKRSDDAVVIANGGAGGVVLFSGSTIGEVLVKADQYCASNAKDHFVVPTTFYRLRGKSSDELMTFECKRNPVGE